MRGNEEKIEKGRESKKRAAIAVIVTLAVLAALTAALKFKRSRSGRLALSNRYEGSLPQWAYESMREDAPGLAEGADCRIMSYNVLVGSWGGDGIVGAKCSDPALLRAQMLSEVLSAYSPDVIGIQELGGSWHRKMSSRWGDYKLLSDKKSDYTALAYNASRVKLIDSGRLYYNERTSDNMRYVEWGCFELPRGGGRFTVTTTHLDFGKERKEIQRTQIRENKELAGKLFEKYGAPVFMTGDFNALERDTAEAADVYQAMLEDGFSRDCKFEKNIFRHSESQEVWDAESWDHIFVKGGAEIRAFGIPSSEFFSCLSDHFPVFCDADLSNVGR